MKHNDPRREMADVIGLRQPAVAFCYWALDLLNFLVKAVCFLAAGVALCDFIGLAVVTFK